MKSSTEKRYKVDDREYVEDSLMGYFLGNVLKFCPPNSVEFFESLKFYWWLHGNLSSAQYKALMLEVRKTEHLFKEENTVFLNIWDEWHRKPEKIQEDVNE